MSDSQHPGLDELGQRVQAMSAPVTDPRLRPYQGAPLPVGASLNGRPISSAERTEDFRTTQPVPPVAAPTPSPAGVPAFADSNHKPANPLPGISGSANPSFPPYAGQFWDQDPAAAASSLRTSDSKGADPPASSWEQIATPPHKADPAPAPSAPATAAAPADPAEAPKSGLQRAIDAVRSALPLVQKLLPLLDGNIATTLGALVAPQPIHHTPPPPPVVHVDLEPVERGLAEVRTSHRELKTQVQEQVTTLKRVEDQLERVREATDRNTLEQQELVEDLRTVGSRVSFFAIVGLVLLLLSLGLNAFFLVQLQHILR